METGDEQEFIIAYVLWGGIILAGILISSALTLVGYAVINRMTIQKAMKIIYNKYLHGKEKNGREKT